LDAALHLGAERAHAVSEPIMKQAREIIGLLPAR
jgi:hypothetical protein